MQPCPCTTRHPLPSGFHLLLHLKPLAVTPAIASRRLHEGSSVATARHPPTETPSPPHALGPGPATGLPGAFPSCLPGGTGLPAAPPSPLPSLAILHYLPRLRVALARHDATAPHSSLPPRRAPARPDYGRLEKARGGAALSCRAGPISMVPAERGGGSAPAPF